MTFIEHLQLIKRNLIKVVLITAAISIAGLIIGSNYMQSIDQVTIFTSISVKEDTNNNSLSTSYDDVQAADHFTETIQGWFKNPIFVNTIKSDVQIDSLSAERQEKQNLFINYTIDDPAKINPSVETIKEKLNAEMEKYNQASGTDFQIALFGYESSIKEAKTIYLIIFLIILGLATGIAYAYLSEYLQNKIQSEKQLENIFGQLVDENLHTSLFNAPKLKYIPTYLQTQKIKKINIIGVGYKSNKTLNILKQQLDHKDVSVHSFPVDINEDISSDPKNFNLLVIKLGKTTMQDVKMIKKIVNDQIVLVTI